MIPALLCLLLPAVGGCSRYVEYAPPINQIAQHQSFYTGKTVLLTGRVRDLVRGGGAGRELYVVFSLCRGACVRVFMEGSSPVRDAEMATVRGAYYQAYRLGRKVYPNEIEATEIVPRE